MIALDLIFGVALVGWAAFWFYLGRRYERLLRRDPK